MIQLWAAIAAYRGIGDDREELVPEEGIEPTRRVTGARF